MTYAETEAGLRSEAELHLAAALKLNAELVKMGLLAIGDHFPPHSCYSTGPMTGSYTADLVACPACAFIAMATRIEKGEPS